MDAAAAGGYVVGPQITHKTEAVGASRGPKGTRGHGRRRAPREGDNLSGSIRAALSKGTVGRHREAGRGISRLGHQPHRRARVPRSRGPITMEELEAAVRKAARGNGSPGAGRHPRGSLEGGQPQQTGAAGIVQSVLGRGNVPVAVERIIGGKYLQERTGGRPS